MLPKCTLRQASRSADVGQLVAFYEHHRHPHVLPRPEADYARAVERGMLFVVQTDEDEIVAASGVFELSPGLTTHLELGGTLVAPAFQGFRLQQLLLQARVAQAVANYYDPMPELLSAVDPSNAPSLHNLGACGFETWHEPIPAVLEPCEQCPKRAAVQHPRACCCDFFILPREKKVEAVKLLLGALPETQRARKDGASTLVVRFKGLLFEDEDYRAALEDFVGQ